MATNEWYAVEVGGTTTDLISNLNALQNQGYEIFSVVIAPKGWTVVAWKAKTEDKPKEVPAAESQPPEPSRRGTILLHKGHKK